MRMLTFLLTLALPLIAQAQSKDFEKDLGDTRERDTAAQKALLTFKKMVEDKSATIKVASFPEGVSQVELGAPIRVAFMRQDQLAKYEFGTDLKTLLVDSGRVIYPVKAGKAVGSPVGGEITIQKDPRKKSEEARWIPITFAGTTPERGIFATRKKIVERTKVVDANAIFAVEVPFLNLQFCAYRTESELYMVPVQGSATLGIVADEPTSAREMLRKLAEAARKDEGEGAPR